MSLHLPVAVPLKAHCFSHTRTLLRNYLMAAAPLNNENCVASLGRPAGSASCVQLVLFSCVCSGDELSRRAPRCGRCPATGSGRDPLRSPALGAPTSRGDRGARPSGALTTSPARLGQSGPWPGSSERRDWRKSGPSTEFPPLSPAARERFSRFPPQPVYPAPQLSAPLGPGEVVARERQRGSAGLAVPLGLPEQHVAGARKCICPGPCPCPCGLGSCGAGGPPVSSTRRFAARPAGRGS